MKVIELVRIRYTLGLARIFGQEFPPNKWVEVNDSFVKKVRNANGWEIEDETLQEPAEEVLEETVEEETEELVEAEESDEESEGEEESVDLTLLTKKELQALCDERGLEYKKLDNKATLLELLED